MTNLQMVSNAIRNLVNVEYGVTNICKTCGTEYGIIKGYRHSDICPDCLQKECEDADRFYEEYRSEYSKKVAEWNADNKRRSEEDKDLLKSYKLSSPFQPNETIYAYSFKQAEQVLCIVYPHYLNGANLSDNYGNFLCLAVEEDQYYQDLRAMEIESGLR
jgi:hypothetical protein